MESTGTGPRQADVIVAPTDVVVYVTPVPREARKGFVARLWRRLRALPARLWAQSPVRMVRVPLILALAVLLIAVVELHGDLDPVLRRMVLALTIVQLGAACWLGGALGGHATREQLRSTFGLLGFLPTVATVVLAMLVVAGVPAYVAVVGLGVAVLSWTLSLLAIRAK